MAKTFTITFPDHTQEEPNRNSELARARMSKHLEELSCHLLHWPDLPEAAVATGTLSFLLREGPVALLACLKGYEKSLQGILPENMQKMLQSVVRVSVHSHLVSDRQREEIEAEEKKLLILRESGSGEGVELPDLALLPVPRTIH